MGSFLLNFILYMDICCTTRDTASRSGKTMMTNLFRSLSCEAPPLRL